MGTGVNAQRRLKALHHLDVPWLPSQIEQREGRIERQGNENDEIELYAYATRAAWTPPAGRTSERKARFIGAAMSGDRTSAGSRTPDPGEPVRARQGHRLGRRTAHAEGGAFEAEIARLERLRDSHFDDQFAIRRKIDFGEKRLADATRRTDAITQDLARRIPTRGEAFAMTIGDRRFAERKAAGEALIALARKMKSKKAGAVVPIAEIGGFAILVRTSYFEDIELRLDRAAASSDAIACERDASPLGLVSRLESRSAGSISSLPKNAARSPRSPPGSRASRRGSATRSRMRRSSRRSAPKWPNSTRPSPRPCPPPRPKAPISGERPMMPASIVRALTNPAFTAAEFSPTQWDSAEDKAKFANALMKFIAGDFPRQSFTKSLYRRLSKSYAGKWVTERIRRRI